MKSAEHSVLVVLESAKLLPQQSISSGSSSHPGKLHPQVCSVAKYGALLHVKELTCFHLPLWLTCFKLQYCPACLHYDCEPVATVSSKQWASMWSPY